MLPGTVRKRPLKIFRKGGVYKIHLADICTLTLLVYQSCGYGLFMTSLSYAWRQSWKYVVITGTRCQLTWWCLSSCHFRIAALPHYSSKVLNEIILLKCFLISMWFLCVIFVVWYVVHTAHISLHDVSCQDLSFGCCRFFLSVNTNFVSLFYTAKRVFTLKCTQMYLATGFYRTHCDPPDP